MPKKKMTNRDASLTASFDEDLKADLKTPQESAQFLSFCLRESKATFLLGIKKVAEAQVGLSKLAKKTHLNRENLYDVLSVNGNPRYDTLSSVLKGLGLGLIVTTLDASGKPEVLAASVSVAPQMHVNVGACGYRGIPAPSYAAPENFTTMMDVSDFGLAGPYARSRFSPDIPYDNQLPNLPQAGNWPETAVRVDA